MNHTTSLQIIQQPNDQLNNVYNLKLFFAVLSTFCSSNDVCNKRPDRCAITICLEVYLIPGYDLQANNIENKYCYSQLCVLLG